MPSEAPVPSREEWRGAVGISVGHGFAPLAESVALAVEAERAGLDLVSIGDSGSETFSLLGAIAGRTHRVGLLSGVAQWTRTPVTLSHAAKTVQNLSGGRYCLGIGPMPRHWSEEWHGIQHEPAGSRMRDYVAATRAALAATPQEPTNHRGPFFRTVGYPGREMTPERPVPIHIAASRRRMTVIAAEIADGIMFNSIQPLEWLAGEGRTAVAEGLARSGRGREQLSTGVMRFCGIDTDRSAAYEHARRAVAFYFAIPYFRALLEPFGFAPELEAGEAALGCGDVEAQVAAVSDRMIDAVALAGTPEEVVAKLAAVQEHVDYVVVASVLGQSRSAAAQQTVRLIETFAPVSRHSRRRPARLMRASDTVHGGYLDTPGGQLHYRERGAGVPVVLLHQTASSSVQWERLMARFPAGYRLLAMDTPGFGASSGPDEAPDGLGWYADRVASFMAGLGIDRAAVVGHHTGAMIAAELAVRRPDLVNRLTLIGCVVIEDAAERAAAAEGIRHWSLDSGGRFLEEYLMPRLRLSVTTDDAEHLQREMIAYLQAGPDYEDAYRAVYGYPAADRLPLIRVPTWCVLPRHEPPNLTAWTKRATNLIPGAVLAQIEGGTEVCFQSPDALRDELLDILTTPLSKGAP